MRTHKLHWISGLALAVSFLTGCAKDDGTDTGAETTGTPDDSTSTDPTNPSSMSMSETTSMTMTSATTTTDPSMTEPSTITVSTETTAGPDPLPNGEMCDDNAMCESAMCFVVGPLGGICGECLSDADCAASTGGGCSIPNPLAMPPQGAECNMGEPGEGCMSDEVCADEQVCAEILNVPGILVASTCSECIEDAGCDKGQLCSPQYNVAELSGVKTCVDPGTVKDGIGCDLDGTGNDACASGFCQPADVLGVLELGVCSACATDEDCMNGDVCVPPAIDLEAGLVAGACAPPK